MDRRPVTLNVNGQDYEVTVEARHTLLDGLRDGCGLTGTHAGCEHGVCGSCTVLVDGVPVRSCLMFAAQAVGHTVRTVEGLRGAEGELHPLQQSFIDNHALQCGFCTPGFLMLAAGAIESNPMIDEEEVRELVSSNLCRCTGYKTIVDAVCAAAATMRSQ